ncbi:MAG TPA: hypothetical protein VIU38_07335 [Anaerolineales bacterium]
MRRLANLTLVFAILFLIFIIGLPFLSSPFGPYPLMKVQDAVDLLTPLVLIPVYWLLFQVEPGKAIRNWESILFLILAALWVEGQGIHLAANSIGHLTAAFGGTDAAALTDFYDEVLSHYMWHSGIIGLSLLIIYRQWKNPFVGMRTGPGIGLGAGIVHGLSYGLMVLEGVTIPIGLPAAALVVLFGMLPGRGKLREQPVLLFFFIAYLTALILFIVWRVYWGCFIEPLDALQHLGTRGC